MPRRSQQSNAEKLRHELVKLLSDFEKHLHDDDLRTQVVKLVPAYQLLRDMGSSLVSDDAPSARDRIIYYLCKYPLTVIDGEELMVVAGISEWARRIRELRVEFGWPILTGTSASDMALTGDLSIQGVNIENLKPDQYILLRIEPDREAAYRWNIANEIKKAQGLSIRDKILLFLRKNTGKPVTGEELRYVANGRTEWARRVRELRTEHGWPIITKQTGMAELPVGTYLLELDRQAPAHDRKIPDLLRAQVLRRDGFKCQNCGWHIDEYNRADPRILELHHKQHHVDGGANTLENLVTLCNLCHDNIHAEDNN